MMMKTLTEKRFFHWVEDEISVTLRNRSGSYGGGSEVLVIEEGTAQLHDRLLHGSRGGIVAETLMARDYKDPQCVVIEDDSEESADSRNTVRQRISR